MEDVPRGIFRPINGVLVFNESVSLRCRIPILETCRQRHVRMCLTNEINKVLQAYCRYSIDSFSLLFETSSLPLFARRLMETHFPFFAHPMNPYVLDSSDEEEKAKVLVGTAALLDFLRATRSNSNADFTLSLGADAFMDLTAGKWKESARVLEHLVGSKERSRRGLVVFHRSSSSTSSTDDAAAVVDDEDLSRRLQETGARLMRIGHLGSISSSQVRECRDVEQLETMVVPRVLEYMRVNHLYQFANRTTATDGGGVDDDAAA